MANTISKHELPLVKYLKQQIDATLMKIKELEKGIQILNDGDDTFTLAVSEVIDSKLNDISELELILTWLDTKLTQSLQN